MTGKMAAVTNPKAKIPRCTAQAKRYSELDPEFARLGARVYGVATTPPRSSATSWRSWPSKGG